MLVRTNDMVEKTNDILVRTNAMVEKTNDVVITNEDLIGACHMKYILTKSDITHLYFREQFQPYSSSIVRIVGRSGRITYSSVHSILLKLCNYMHMANGGLVYDWTYKGKQCYVLLTWHGTWGLYVIASTSKMNTAIKYSSVQEPIYAVRWNVDNTLCMYNIYIEPCVLGRDTDKVFNDVSFCMRAVTRFVDHITD
jgi:hypothetical protein